MITGCRCVSCITPPHLLEKLLESEDRDVRRNAMNTLLTTVQLRSERTLQATLGLGGLTQGDGRRTIFDCRGETDLSEASVARSENGEPANDEAVNLAFDGFGKTRSFYTEVFDRDSIDGGGMRLDGYVHYGQNYNNAFWNGRQMVFGDGDGLRFANFTRSTDVIAHELTHGVTEYTAGLEYHNEPGALNESMSDVFGSLVKQWADGLTAEEADWLIGADIFTPGVEADALRSLKAPGTAYDNPEFGRDPQPDHMSKYVRLPDTYNGDWGGVHINSGIPNKAFYATAILIGGYAWDAPGHIWYESLKASSVKTDFQAFADMTYLQAGRLYGASSDEQQAVAEAWRDVGLRISGIVGRTATSRRLKTVERARSSEIDTLAELVKTVETLGAQVKALGKSLSAMKKA